MLPDRLGHDEPAEPPDVSEEEGDKAAGVIQRLGRRVSSGRSWVYARPGGAHIWRTGIAVVGLVVIVVGIVLLAAPGPGWLVIFVGLGIWATEFAWARSLLRFVQRTVRTGTAWVRRQPCWLIVLVGGVGLIIVGAVAVGAWVLVGRQ